MITNPPVLIGRTFFYCGLQIRRDAWRWTFWVDLQSAYLIDYFIARIILFFPKASSLVSISLKSSFSSISRVSFS